VQLENRGTAEFIAGFVDSAQKQGLQPPKMPPRRKNPVPVPPTPLAEKSPAKQSKPTPPVPPKKKTSTAPLKARAKREVSPSATSPAPVPAPTFAAPNRVSSDDRSSLLASIRAAGPRVLKPVNEDTKSTPSAPDPHSALLSSIRSACPLKPTPNSSSPASTASSKAGSIAESQTDAGDPSEMMAAMLAKALAARNRRLGDSDEENEDSGDDGW